jgi:hypothetical protein
MPNHGFKAYDYNSEIYFTQYNNQYVLTKPVSQSIEYVRQIDMGVSYERFYVEFLLPAWLIRFFRENNLKFAFIPLAGYGGDRFKSLYVGIINYYNLYRDLDNWDGQSDIKFKVYIRPRSLTVYSRLINRLRESDDRNASAKIYMQVLVGFR